MSAEARATRPRRPRLRTVLLTVNLLILLLPVGGIAVLRLYENELIRGTEAQLLAQGALVREAFREEYRRQAAAAGRLPPWSDLADAFGGPLPEDWRPEVRADGDLVPLQASIDISRDAVRPPAPEGRRASRQPDPLAAAGGEVLTPVLDQAGNASLAGIRVVDMHGLVVASSGSELGLSLADREEVARALEGEEVSLLRQRISDERSPPLQSISRGQRYRVFVALPVIEAERVVGAVVLSRTPLDISKALYLKRRPLLIGAAAVIAVVVIVSVLTSLTISRPVRALIHQADQVTRGEKGALVPLRSPGTHELAQLSESLAGMARTLESRTEYIRTFASHVSHEFKTPLTTLRGTVELLDERFDEMTEEERQGFLENLAAASARLERLVGRLLEQARADVLRPGAERTDLAEAVGRAVRRHRHSGLEVSARVDTEVGDVAIAGETLGEILSNLLDNARQHGGEGVRVLLEIRRDPTAPQRWVELRVSDDGPGISESNAVKVFTPFFTTAREQGGSGLGLSIVRSLLEAHGGTIGLERRKSGTAFLLRLPSA